MSEGLQARTVLACIDQQIAALQAQREEVTKELAEVDWPKRTTLYVHRSKERNYDQGQELGLTGEALEKFLYTFCEVGIDVEVHKDGKVTIRAIDGKPVQR